MNYLGTIIEESLGSKAVLQNVKILSTRVEEVTEKHQTPWLQQWTLHKVEIAEDKAERVAEQISHDLETAHSAWYADYKNETWHYIVFPNKVFKIDRDSREQHDRAKQYGLSLGIPAHQVDF